MVQKNTPYLNRSGYSMFWNSMWDSEKNFSKNLQINFFLNNFIYFFFSDFIQNKFLKYYKNKINISNFLQKYNFNIFVKNPNFIFFYLNNLEKNIFTSKIWLFRFNNWIVIYFYIFSKSKFIHNNKKFLDKKLNDFFIKNIIYKYNLNLKKINSNKNYLNNFFLKNNF